ncbi:MAG: glycosyltransferase family 2 protein [Prevotellaceae bacterium]|jgi:GT2 family glycosyltransferase|nr:glycosyltransferase family 2 protein [Prevotellaceae bacterium]
MNSRISASIVLYHTSVTDVEKLLRCLLESPIEQIYLIDNSRTDKLKYLQTLSATKIRYLFNNKNIGFGAAHNIALKAAIAERANYHIVLNSDLEFDNGIIENLSAYMDAHLNVGLIMPKVLYPDNSVQYLCKLLPEPFDLIFRRFLPLKEIVNKRNTKYEMHASNYNCIMNIPNLSGCFMFLRVSSIQETGLFDERFYMYCEDTDLVRRIHQKYQTLFYPQVSIIHQYNKESYRNRRLMWIHIKSAIRYFNKWGWIWDKERRDINKKVIKCYLSAK